MREITLERYRPAGDAASALAHASALAGIFVAGTVPALGALPLALGVTGLGFLLRAAVGAMESSIPREEGSPHRGAISRLFPVYAFFASTTLVMFPQPFGARSLFLLAFCEAPLLAASLLPRGRVVSDVNAAILAAGAAATGGAGSRFFVALWLAATVATLALRHLEERAAAARWDGEEDLSPALATGGLAAALVLGVFVLAATLIPLDPDARARPGQGVDLERAAEVFSRQMRAHTARSLLAVALAVVLPIAGLYAWRKISEWLRRGMGGGGGRGDGDEGSLPLGAPEALPDEEEAAPTLDASTSGRSGVVAAYRRLEAALAARDLGRAPSEGASEHAAHLAGRFPSAAEALDEVARRFAAARYGQDEPSEGSPRATRSAVERALREIDRES